MNVIIYLIIGGAFLLPFYMWGEAHRNRIRMHQLAFEQLPQSFHGYRLFFISDVHRRLISLSVINKLKDNVDFIVIGGDLCEKGVKVKRVEENIKRLSSIAPSLFVWGNNDCEIGRAQLRILLQKYDVVELVNSVKTIEKNNEKINFAGVGDLKYQRDDLTQVISESEGSFSILVTHFPNVVDRLPAPHPFSLILSGHTHGGQIRIFGWGLEKKGCLSTHSSYRHLISNGYGTTGLPLRLGASSETHLLVLMKTDDPST